jgi:PASTA domain
MPGDIKVPGLGEIPKKYAVLGVVGAAGLGVVVYLRARSAAKTAAATDSTTSDTSADTSADTGTDSGIDPSTGVPYADESSYDTSIDPNTGIPYADETGYGDGGNYSTGTSDITTNDQWISEAISGAVPGNPGTIESAIAGVLGGLTVTTAQKNIFMEAVGILGPPPGGYPTPIKTSDTAGHPGPAAKIKVPSVVNESQESAFAKLSAAGLHASGSPPVKGKVLMVTKQSPQAGTAVNKGSTVQLTSKVT